VSTVSPVRAAQARLKQLLEGPLPESARSGSLQQAMAFKDWASKASKQVSASIPNHITITSLIAQRLDMK
jgi:hypothetical protein